MPASPASSVASSAHSLRAFVALASVSVALLSAPLAHAQESAVSPAAASVTATAPAAMASAAPGWVDQGVQGLIGVGLVALMGSLLWSMGGMLASDFRKKLKHPTPIDLANRETSADVDSASHNRELGAVLMVAASQTGLASGAGTVLSATASVTAQAHEATTEPVVLAAPVIKRGPKHA